MDHEDRSGCVEETINVLSNCVTNDPGLPVVDLHDIRFPIQFSHQIQASKRKSDVLFPIFECIQCVDILMLDLGTSVLEDEIGD